jgi:hypothetical protein
MSKIRIANPKDFFLTLVLSQALFACLVLGVEIAGQSRWFPMTLFPNEHKGFWVKVTLYCVGAFLSVLVVWIFSAKKPSRAYMPSLKSVLLPGTVFTLSSVLISHYLSAWGWCCESRSVFYFGFPFSYLLGVGGYEYASLLPFENLSLFEVLGSPGLVEFWRIYPYQLFLDLLFWSNGVLVLTSVIRRLPVGKSKSIAPVRG